MGRGRLVPGPRCSLELRTLVADLEDISNGDVDTSDGFAERMRSADQVSAVRFVLFLPVGQVCLLPCLVGQGIAGAGECPLNPVGELAIGQVIREQQRQRRRRII